LSSPLNSPRSNQKSEPNVGRVSDPIRVVTLWLAILLAWPWNVALSAIETSQNAAPADASSSLIAGTHRGHRVNRFGRWVQSGCPAISQDYETGEEEGDAVGPWQAAPWLPLLTRPPEAPELASGSPAQALTRPPIPVARRCRLRC
jgi:hypothetical protein